MQHGKPDVMSDDKKYFIYKESYVTLHIADCYKYCLQ